MAYLNTALMDDAEALGAPEVEEMRDAWLAFVAEMLAEHDADYGLTGRVVAHTEEIVLKGRDRKARIDLMGAHARYFEAEYVGSGTAQFQTADGAVLARAHRWRAYLYYGIGKAGESNAEAADAFLALLWQRAEPRGLLHATDVQGYLTIGGEGTGGDEVLMTLEGEVVAPETPVKMGEGEYRHEATFVVALAQ